MIYEYCIAIINYNFFLILFNVTTTFLHDSSCFPRAFHRTVPTKPTVPATATEFETSRETFRFKFGRT